MAIECTPVAHASHLRQPAQASSSRLHACLAAARRSLAGIAVAGIAAATVATPASAREDHYFAIGYTVSLNGIPLGKGSFSGRVAGGAYRLKGDARLTGIAGMLFEYKATGEVDGRLGRANHSPRRFGSSASDERSSQVVSMSFSRGRVDQLSIRPTVRASKDYISVRSGHMTNVVDPMTAMIISAGSDGTLSPDDCNRTIPVFNGRERFDLVLRYKGMQNVSGNRRTTYVGPAVVCQALYRPIAGHRPGRSEIEYYASRKDMEVWLAPAGDTGLLVPVRMVVPTPIGTGIIQATAFAASYASVGHTAATR